MAIRTLSPTLSRRVALLALLLCAGGPAQAAATLFATCSARIATSDPNIGALDSCIGRSNALLEGTEQQQAIETKGLPTGIWSIEAMAGYSARGSDGNLGVAVSSLAAVPSTNVEYLGVQGETSVSLASSDSLTVTSGTLALGAPVTITVSGHFEGSAGGQMTRDNIFTTLVTGSYVRGTVTVQENFLGTSLFPHRVLDTCRGYLDCNTSGDTAGGAFRVDYSETFDVLVGSVLSFSAGLQAVSLSGVSVPSGGLAGYATSRALSMNSLATFFMPVSTDVQLVAASGHDYGVPPSVPEPATLALFGLGLASLLGWRRRSGA